MQIEHVTNAKTVIGTNYPKTENCHENPKEQRTMQKHTKKVKMQAVG